MNWIATSFRLFQARDDIARLLQMVGPAAKAIIKVAPEAAPLIRELHALLKGPIEQVMKVSPEAVPLAQRLLAEIAPDLQDEPQEAFSVEWLQESLNKLNGEKLVVDGDPGELTKEAVKRYQKAHGLEVDGWAGIKTTASIYNELKRIGK